MGHRGTSELRQVKYNGSVSMGLERCIYLETDEVAIAPVIFSLAKTVTDLWREFDNTKYCQLPQQPEIW